MKTPPPQDNLRVRVELNGTVYEEDLAAQTGLNLDLAGLNQALAEQPGRFAWWATLEALARAKHEDLTAQLEALDAVLFGQYQTELRTLAENAVKANKSPTVKEPTLDAIRSRTHLDKNRMILDATARQARLDADLVQVGRRTMEHRKDTVIAIANNMRAEMDLKLYVGKSRLPDTQPDHVRPTRRP